MSALVIVLIILLGLFLLILEFFVFPGVTFAGIGGFIFTAGGIFLTYQVYGASYGHIALVATLFVGLLILFFSFRSTTWNRIMLHSQVQGRVETVEALRIQEGDEGMSLTRLNPIGKVMVNGEVIEGKCPGHFIDENSPVIVKEVFKTYIIVKPKN
ncbi:MULTISPECIES: NfeD family protein [unclassified Carboxylicivirga]|uniref:NfeD family protein n=1 Tax=Carboxylicivirga TaxID=1628153 RepID=UPI003D34D4CA